MTNEELLIPRCKVIANYPYSMFSIGQVITLDKFSSGKWWHECTEAEPIHLEEGCEIMYPAIFRKMEWIEKRTIEEMPKYLVCYYGIKEIDFVLKVEKYLFHKESTTALWAFEYLWKNEPDIKRMSLNGWFPSCEEEYLSHNAILK